MEYKLFDLFGSEIMTRRAMSNFFDFLSSKDDQNIIIDFSNVNFISRSCADEYIRNRRNFNRNLTEVNISDNVKEMFNLVLRQFKRENGLIC